jgi:ribosomal protein L11 methyltransferase
MDWIEIEVRARTGGPEPVAAALLAVGSAGASITGDDPLLPAPGVEGPCTVRGYLPADERLPGALEELRGRLGALRGCGLDVEAEPQLRTVREEDWATAWKAFYHPLRIGRRLLVKPTWEAAEPRPGDLVIELDPGMAFGTGLHPTTQLCLEELEEQVRPGERLLDWGTGSAILAIAAARLGASRITAVDNDPVATAAAQANARLNGAAATVRVRRGELPRRGQYDGIVANILPDPIIDAAPQLRRLAKPGGWLIASGVSAARGDEVAAALVRAGFAPPAAREREAWLCFVTR